MITLTISLIKFLLDIFFKYNIVEELKPIILTFAYTIINQH